MYVYGLNNTAENYKYFTKEANMPLEASTKKYVQRVLAA